jgi:hypothetical protein
MKAVKLVSQDVNPEGENSASAWRSALKEILRALCMARRAVNAAGKNLAELPSF